MNWWVWLVAVGIILGSSTVLLGRGPFGISFVRPPIPILYMFLVLDVVFILIVFNFGKLDIQVNQESVKVSYGIAKKTIRADEIVSCEAARTRLPLYGGLGLRLGANDWPGYKAGNAVKIVGKAGKSFVIPTNKPAELSKTINNLSMSKLEN